MPVHRLEREIWGVRMRRIDLVGIALAAIFLTVGVAAAWAESATTICVPEQAGNAIVSGTSTGKCTKAKYGLWRSQVRADLRR
jgi:hypothetical protein